MAYDIGTVQYLVGHKDVKTTMMYTHVLNRGGYEVEAPSIRSEAMEDFGGLYGTREDARQDTQGW